MGGARRVGPLLKLIINQGLSFDRMYKLYIFEVYILYVLKPINTTFYPHASAKRLHKGGKSVGVRGWSIVTFPIAPLNCGPQDIQ